MIKNWMNSEDDEINKKVGISLFLYFLHYIYILRKVFVYLYQNGKFELSRVCMLVLVRECKV